MKVNSERGNTTEADVLMVFGFLAVLKETQILQSAFFATVTDRSYLAH